MTYHFRNLVFEGGGVKGIAYLGALQELEQRGIATLGVKTTQFDLDDDTKHGLVQSWRDGVTKYFEWYDAVPQAANK